MEHASANRRCPYDASWEMLSQALHHSWHWEGHLWATCTTPDSCSAMEMRRNRLWATYALSLPLQTDDGQAHFELLKKSRSEILEKLSRIKSEIMELETLQQEAVRQVPQQLNSYYPPGIISSSSSAIFFPLLGKGLSLRSPLLWIFRHVCSTSTTCRYNVVFPSGPRTPSFSFSVGSYFNRSFAQLSLALAACPAHFHLQGDLKLCSLFYHAIFYFSLHVTPSIFLSILIWVNLIVQPSVFVSVHVSAAFNSRGNMIVVYSSIISKRQLIFTEWSLRINKKWDREQRQ